MGGPYQHPPAGRPGPPYGPPPQQPYVAPPVQPYGPPPQQPYGSPPPPPYGVPPQQPYGAPQPPYGAPQPPPFGGGPGGYRPPYNRPPNQQYAFPARPVARRRSGAGVVAGILGGLAFLFVVAIVGLSALAHSAAPPTVSSAGSDGGGTGTATGGGGTGGTGSGTDGGGPSGATTSLGDPPTTNSPLYGTGGLVRVGCRLPRIAPNSTSMGRFMNTLSDCLDAAWSRQFKQAGLSFSPPQRAFWTSPGGSPCGSYPAPGASAFYCSSNNTMYIGLSDIIKTSANTPLTHFAVYAGVVAHEYGHHAQDQAGILAAGGQQEANAPDQASRLELNRRLELQAQCFSGMFLGTERASLGLTRQQFKWLVTDSYYRGDDRQPPGMDRHDHGISRDYAGWMNQGYQVGTLPGCNTWRARAADVR